MGKVGKEGGEEVRLAAAVTDLRVGKSGAGEGSKE